MLMIVLVHHCIRGVKGIRSAGAQWTAHTLYTHHANLGFLMIEDQKPSPQGWFQIRFCGCLHLSGYIGGCLHGSQEPVTVVQNAKHGEEFAQWVYP